MYSEVPPTKLRDKVERFRPARTSKFWLWVADRFFYNMLENRFYAMRYKGIENLQSLGKIPTIFFAPHSNWWDGIVGYNLCNRLLKREIRLMVEELNRFPLLRRGGAFNVNKKSAQASMAALKYSVDLLSDLNNITNKKSEIEILLDNYYKKKEELDKLNKELDILKLDKTKYEESIKETENTLNSANGNINKKEKELNNLNIEVNRMDVKLDNLLNKLSSDYNITFEYAKEYFKLEIDAEDARREVNSLKNRINSIGEVNLGSIEEYDRVNTRYEFLTNQKNDLLNAKDTLNEIINEMDNIMENKFYETFKLIKVEFAKVFRELFKGGKAELILTDPDDLLNTGIEIKAEPPGKKLQSITLLSGGEKTFTAISLLFAILNVRPVPFCIFDEVEAALDDANVENFGKYLDTYRDKTQFILITHKKKTMEFADILYGVTMQESGVSKLVSVRLEDIKK